MGNAFFTKSFFFRFLDQKQISSGFEKEIQSLDEAIGGLKSTQTLGPILDGAMRNTLEGREFVRVSMKEGVKAAVIKRDGPFNDYSQGNLEDQPRKRSEL